MIKISNSFDPDQNRSSVGPDLGPNCLKKLSADDKRCHYFQISPAGTVSDSQMVWIQIKTNRIRSFCQS